MIYLPDDLPRFRRPGYFGVSPLFYSLPYAYVHHNVRIAFLGQTSMTFMIVLSGASAGLTLPTCRAFRAVFPRRSDPQRQRVRFMTNRTQ